MQSFCVFALPQQYDEIVTILKSLPSVKNVRLEINASFWGEEFAAGSEQAKFSGTVDRWVNSQKLSLYVCWEGYTRNQNSPLDKMNVDAHGDSLGLRLLPYGDGRPPPVLNTNPAPATGSSGAGVTAHPAGQADAEDDDGEEHEVAGQLWRKRDPHFVSTDLREQARMKPTLNKGGLVLDGISALFTFLLPPKWITLILEHTNPLLNEHDAVNAKLSEGELLRFMGYMLSLSIHSGIPLGKMWSRTPLPDSTATPPHMGRFGMSHNRFMKIKSVLRTGPSDDASFQANDWCFCEPLLDAFNEHMQNQIIPGWLLGADESISAWRGKAGKGDITKCPHLMFVKRKPEPLGAEFKNIGDALSGMILNMEITKGKAELIKPKFWSKENGATAATTMRLSEPWFGSNRVVAGDSWFASVRTAELLAQNGMYFIGDVKTGTRRFPLELLKEATHEDNGSWAVFTSELQLGGDRTIPVYSVSHRRGQSLHGFVATCGTTLPGKGHNAYFEDDEERTMAETVEHEIARKCPRVLNDFTLAQPTIDRHNRYRQHILAMEKRFITNSFTFRFFTTMLGMLAVNAFFAHRYFNNALAEFKIEIDKLALALINNPKIGPPTQQQQRSPGGSRSPSSLAASPDGQPHILAPLRQLDSYKGGKQQRCIICNERTIWFCTTCTTGPHALVPLCPEVSRGRRHKAGFACTHRCLLKHMANPTYYPKGKRQSKRARGSSDSDDAASQCGSDCL